MSDSELIVTVRPDGLLLEWGESADHYSEQSLHFQQDLYRRYHSESDTWLLSLSFSDPELKLSPSLVFWREVCLWFSQRLALLPDLEEVRDKAMIHLGEDKSQEFLDLAPLCIGAEYLNFDLLEMIWSTLNKTFRRLIKSYHGTVEAFIHSYSPNLQLAGRIFFHLVENKKGNAPFAFLATYSTRMGSDDTSRHLPLKYALQEYGSDRDRLLELLGTVYRAARDSEMLSHLLESGEIFHPLGWGPKETHTFLKEVPLYEQSGILCRIPNWWNAKSAGTRLNVTIGSDQPPFVGMDAVLNCVPGLSINGIPISPQETRKLLEESDGLALIKNKWVTVDKEKLRQTLEAYEKARGLFERDGLTFREAVSLQLNSDNLLGVEQTDVELSVSYGDWLEEVTRKLVNPTLVKSISPADGFQGTLRPYQQAGLSWLAFLGSLGFGACLADDMGLGKTIQILAFLSVKKCENCTSLLVVPASLIANWASEIDRFYPDLAYHIAHPGNAGESQTPPKSPISLEQEDLSFRAPASSRLRLKNLKPTMWAKDELSQFDLVITTYGMAQRYDSLQTFGWDYLILDEAQAIKNPGTKQTKAIKKLLAANRIILTGTPVENRLSDLWSLFDFLNPGLLGNLKEFKAFAKSLKSDPTGYCRLRKVVSPYILRRLKTDQSIISDLPEKVEMKSFASLSKKQIVLYRNLVDETKEILENSDGIQRRGLILSSLMKFKQLCNHPDQFLGTGGYAEEDSGKFKRLREICETVLEKREKMLIFTQFTEIIPSIHDFLAAVFGRNGVVLHGSIPVKKRKALVDTFQSRVAYTPFMVLSLKAGGVGLNLTEANHVVHFDRWWNPAVENQATDRAFRIGQKKNVVVHKFITQGTIEEKIDEMLEEKSRLSDEIISSGGEGWITELENDQLMELFSLGLA